MLDLYKAHEVYVHEKRIIEDPQNQILPSSEDNWLFQFEKNS